MTNKRLEKLQPLRHRVAIYVPGTDGVNTAADVVYAYAAGEDLERKLDTVINVCADMQQEAVSLEIDGSLYFI